MKKYEYKHIKFIKPDSFNCEDDAKEAMQYIHLMNPLSQGGEFTLCGIAFDGDGCGRYDDNNDDVDILETDEKISCPDCISWIDFCKSVKAKQIAKKLKK